MTTPNQYVRFGNVGTPRDILMMGLSGGRLLTQPGKVVSVENFSTGNLSGRPVTDPSFNLNIVNAASDPNIRALTQAMVAPIMRLENDGRVSVVSSRVPVVKAYVMWARMGV